MSLYPSTRFENPRSVQIDERRWDITITVVDDVGGVHRIRASADSYYTGNSGISVFEVDENGKDVATS
jgi:hypothetical protein